MGIEHEVKGVWFVATGAYLQEHHGSKCFRAVVGRLEPDVQPTLSEPMASAWYPEEHLKAMLHALDDELAKGDPDRFITEVMGCAQQGINRFFRALVRLSSPAFVLKHSPTTWQMLRRGSGTMNVRPIPEGTMIEYRHFPYFGDRLYRLLTEGSVRGLVQFTTQEAVETEVVRYATSDLDLRVRHSR